jgi:hypothetical protein
MNDIMRLRTEGNVTGVCGNFQVLFKFFPQWYQFFSFYGPTTLISAKPADHMYKHVQLIAIKNEIKAEKYIMVGNKHGSSWVRPGSQDDIQAKLANWDFISERDFAAGKR